MSPPASPSQAPAQNPATPAAPASNNAAPQPFQNASLYVGDIHPDVTEALLFEIFNSVGPVASIRVCRDAVTRRSLGYAYVNFHNVADAERAIDTMNYTSIKGVPCRIMWSQRDPSLRKSGLGNIFVKNLDASIDNKALYDTFSLFGNILSCKVAYDLQGNSKGYGYVHYETDEAAQESIDKINGMLIAGKEVYVGKFQRRSDRPENNDWTNCYVKNIPKTWSDDDLKALFEKFGTISSLTVMKDENNESKGFGFVNFEEPSQAHAAAEELNNSKQLDKGVDAESVKDVKAPVEGEEPAEKTEGVYFLYVGKAQKKSDRERELRNKFESLKMDRITKFQGVNLYVKNLDDQVTDDDLREMFSSCGTITSCRIMRDQNNHSRGFGFVCFSNPEEATKACTDMNGKLCSGKPIYVALAQRREVRRAQLEAQHQQQRNVVLPNPMVHPQAMGRGGMPMGVQPPMYGGPAGPQMFYGQPNQRNGGFMYPQQMMPPRGMPRGYVVGVNQRGPRRQSRGPAPAQNGQPRQNQGNRNFKYTANARNHHEQPAEEPVANPPVPAETAQAPAVEPLTPAALANASPEQQKNMIGERLYPLIHREQPELAGKITGMLLEMDNGELLHLLESPEALSSKIQEAIQVLEAHDQE